MNHPKATETNRGDSLSHLGLRAQLSPTPISFGVSLAVLFTALVSGGIETAGADERLAVSLGLDSRLQFGSLSFAEETGEEPLGGDLGLGVVGALLGVGIDTRDVTVLVELGVGVGGLSGSSLSEHYPDGTFSSSKTFSIGLGAQFRRPAFGRWKWLGRLGVGYSRQVVGSDRGNAQSNSLTMDLGGGLSTLIQAGEHDLRLGASLVSRIHSVRSFTIPGLTEGQRNPDNPTVFYAPGALFTAEFLY